MEPMEILKVYVILTDINIGTFQIEFWKNHFYWLRKTFFF